MNIDQSPDIRWAAYAVSAAAWAGLIFLLLSFVQAPEVMRLTSDKQETVMLLPNTLMKVSFIALAIEVLTLIPVILVAHRVLSFGSNLWWVYPLITAFGIIGATGLAITQVFLVASKVPMGESVSLSSGVAALLGTWMALGGVCWGEKTKTLPRQFYGLCLAAGVALALTPNFTSFEGLDAPASLTTNYPLLTGLAVEIVSLFIAIPIWALWFVRALRRY